MTPLRTPAEALEAAAAEAEAEGWSPDAPKLGYSEREEGARDCAERIAAAIRSLSSRIEPEGWRPIMAALAAEVAEHRTSLFESHTIGDDLATLDPGVRDDIAKLDAMLASARAFLPIPQEPENG